MSQFGLRIGGWFTDTSPWRYAAGYLNRQSASKLIECSVIFSLAGMLTLFFFGSPIVVRTFGTPNLTPDPSFYRALTDRICDALGWAALLLTLVGAVYGIAAARRR
jgi:hypothetical protein